MHAMLLLFCNVSCSCISNATKAQGKYNPGCIVLQLSNA
jgi:hypothetical protein